MAGDA